MSIAFIGNLSVLETVVIAVVAILIFGRRLPEVAGQVAGQLVRVRRALNDLRRESGIDEELRRAREAAYEDLDPLRREPPAATMQRTARREAGPEGAVAAEETTAAEAPGEDDGKSQQGTR